MKKLIASLLVLACGFSHAKTVQEKPGGYAIASAHPLATNAGLAVLAKGGNAFDAVIAVSAALAVVAPYHSGLGGGGFWLLHRAEDKKNTLIDGREVAPLAAHKTMFWDKNGKVIPELSLNGGLAAAIPGEPAALVYIASHYGKLPLSESLAPAIQLAESGFPVDQQFYNFATMSDRLEQMRKYPATAKVYLHDGRPYSVGECLKQPELAKTLRLLASKGHAGFYQGEVAEKLVAGVKAAGGIWTLKDLSNYQVKEREPLQGAYHNMLIITAPPPSAGGIELLTMLNILSAFSLESLDRAQWIHYLVEAMRLSFWQGNQMLADPDFVKIPVDRLISAAEAKKLRQFISPDKATPSSTLAESRFFHGGKNTTHIAILDKEGNRVSATLTVNFIFGSSVVAEGTGVLLNDEMDDFSSKPGQKNVYGLVGSELNVIEPGKRPLSSMTPSFLEMPGRLAIVGTPGGSRIPTMVLIATLAFYDYGGAISMVSAMRFHHQYLPDWLQFEPDAFSLQIQDKLKKMGYQLMPLDQPYGDMQAITWDREKNIISAASDPRRIGLASVISQIPTGYGLTH